MSCAEYQDSIEKVQGELKQLFAQKKREESEWQKAHDVWTQLKREGQILTEQIQDTNNKIHTLKGNQGKEAAKKREDQITNLKAEMGQIDEKHQAHLEALQTGIPSQMEEKRKQESGLKEGRSMLQRDLDQAKYEEKGLLSALNNAGANSMNRLHQNIRFGHKINFVTCAFLVKRLLEGQSFLWLESTHCSSVHQAVKGSFETHIPRLHQEGQHQCLFASLPSRPSILID